MIEGIERHSKPAAMEPTKLTIFLVVIFLCLLQSQSIYGLPQEQPVIIVPDEEFAGMPVDEAVPSDVVQLPVATIDPNQSVPPVSIASPDQDYSANDQKSTTVNENEKIFIEKKRFTDTIVFVFFIALVIFALIVWYCVYREYQNNVREEISSVNSCGSGRCRQHSVRTV